MSGPRDQWPPAPAEEPWWKNANTRIPPPPPPRAPQMPAQRPPPRPPQPPPIRNRHAKAAPPRRNGGQVALLAVIGIVAISAAAVGLWLGLSRIDMFKGKVLNAAKAEEGVARILVDPVDGYGVTSVSDVVCNNGNDPEIKKGGTFTCDVIVDGRKRTVLVVFSDDNGTYAVDRPR